MAETDNEKLQLVLDQLLKVLTQFLTGTNIFSTPNSAFIPGKSYQHSIGTYYREQEKTTFTTPIANAINDAVGSRIYNSSLRMLGWSQEQIDAHLKTSEGAKFMQGALSFGSSLYYGQAVNAFTNTAYRRMYANPQNMPQFTDSFVQAGKGIVEGISNGSIQGYSVDEAFKVAAMFTRQGRYDYTNQRATKIKKDLQDYAEGINNLRDGLQGSLEQVLDSFAKLTGSSATVMQKDRFTALTRSLYGATTFGGVTPQTLQSAIATQHAYLQGTGATQATGAALGLINANILANGVSVEGASQNSMNEALVRRGTQWITTGRTKEITAAFGWWADTNGKTRSAETFREFVQNSLGGNMSSTNVRRYLQNNNVSGEYINSARNRRNMASPYIIEALHNEDLALYNKNFNKLQRNYGLTEEDQWLTDDELTDKLMKRYTRNGRVSPSDINRITKIVEERRNVIQGITRAGNADDGLNILRNQKQMVAQQQQAKVNKAVQLALGQQHSIGGVAGVLQRMIKNEGVSKDVIAETLGSFLGVDIDTKSLGKLNTKDLNRVFDSAISELTGDKIVSKEERSAYYKFLQEHTNKMSSEERNLLFDTSKDKRKGKDGKTWGDIRKQLLHVRASTANGNNHGDAYRNLLNEAQQQGHISEETAFIADYSYRNKLNVATNPEALERIKDTYNIYKKAKTNGIDDKQARKYAEAVQRIRQGVALQDDEGTVKKALVSHNDFKDLRQAVDNSVEGSDERKKAQQALNDAVEKRLASIKSENGSTDFILDKILSFVKDIAGKMV